MKKYIYLFVAFALIALVSCKPDPVEVQNEDIVLLDSIGWWWENDCPEDLSAASTTVETDTAIKLNFFGWGEDEDRAFELNMPGSGNFRRVLLEYTMCGWNQGPADWDMTTEIRIKNPQDNQWYELQRIITPYGGNFKSGWQKKFYFDVTHLLPMLVQDGPVEFKIFYCGWDATDTKSHACRLKFYFFDGEPEYGNPTFIGKVYDSFTSGTNGYRAWSYGIPSTPIEADERMGYREIHLPEGTKSALLRVCISGHGQERLKAQQAGEAFRGKFPGRTIKVENPAEFDRNWYTIKYNGKTWGERGFIWEENGGGKNYAQAGTYKYDRAGWGPGKPVNVHYWMIYDIPEDGVLKLDLDLEEYISHFEEPNADGVASYYVMADIFGFDR